MITIVLRVPESIYLCAPSVHSLAKRKWSITCPVPLRIRGFRGGSPLCLLIDWTTRHLTLSAGILPLCLPANICAAY